jgi:hypothetical protein
VLQTNVKQALEADQKTQVAISDRPYFVAGKAVGGTVEPGGPRNNLLPDAQLQDFFVNTLGKEDTRRPRMDMGLGIWTSETRRYYPLALIRERGRAFIDRIDGRSALIYIDPETNSPAAMFVNASRAKFEGNDVHLDNGGLVRSGIMLDHKGKPQEADRPQQIFTRWYGFALTFPGAEVVGQ